MFEENYLICFDYDVLAPGLMPLLVLKTKLKQDSKNEKIGDCKRRPRCADPATVFGAQSGSSWEGWEAEPSILSIEC